MSITNRGKFAVLNSYFRATGTPTNFFVALVTGSTAPTVDTNTLGELTQIETGNGYSDGGNSVARTSGGWDVINEDDTNNSGSIQASDVTFTASGGDMPSVGSGARYAVLTNDNGTVANREVYAYWDLTADRKVSDGQSLVLQDLEIRLTEPA
ncbi:MAG: hypothetical protein VW683_00550 [Betaproteobacteria bacterium]|jgi:hypothetical protein